MFLQAMTHYGVSSYFESVMNPPLYTRESENEETVRFGKRSELFPAFLNLNKPSGINMIKTVKN